MEKSLIIVSGCNAAGKSTFIRSRINQFENYCIIMPDVYKSGTYTVFQDALDRGDNIVLENILRDDEVFLMQKGILVEYYKNELSWIQYFSEYVISIGKDLENFERIKHNQDFF